MQAVSDGSLEGVRIKKRCPIISHLFFADDSLFFIRANAANARILRSILDKYSAASGQSINSMKSCIFFSENAADATKAQVEGELGMKGVENAGKYLGLPTVWGRSKREALAFLKDRVVNKLQGWKSLLLNHAGKEVLIKSVITAIPTYTMSLFKLPVTWCKELDSLIAKFWWGQQGEERKIHWKSWEHMTLAKGAGGMGFRDFQTFNVAMLTKTAWRIQNNPSAYWVKVLKGIYFPNSSFLDAKKGSRASWGWSSMLAGRDVLKNNGCWRIGNGGSIRVFQDPWIPGVEGHRLQGSDGDQGAEGMKVEQLIDSQTGNWQLQNINHLLNDEERTAILSITLRKTQQEDKLIWPYNTFGVATPKSVYHFLRSTQNSLIMQLPSSSAQVSSKTWKAIWAIKTIPKIKLFLWKSCLRSLPVFAELQRRRVLPESMCPFCKSDETIEHALIRCSWTNPVWFAGMDIRLELRPELSWTEWLQEVLERATELGGDAEELLVRFSLVAWEIWCERCRATYQGDRPNPTAVIKRVHNLKLEVDSSNRAEMLKRSRSGPHRSTSTALQKWARPDVGSIKINVDGSFDRTTMRGGIAAIARGPGGEIIDGRAQTRRGDQAISMEAQAINLGVEMAALHRWDNVIIESDSQVVVEQLNGTSKGIQWRLENVLGNIQDMANLIPNIQWNFVRRSANRCANWLAIQARKEMCPINWVSQPPFPLLSILLSDCTHEPP